MMRGITKYLRHHLGIAVLGQEIGVLREMQLTFREREAAAHAHLEAKAESHLARTTQLLAELGRGLAISAAQAGERDQSHVDGTRRAHDAIGALHTDLTAFYKDQLSQKLDGLAETVRDRVAQRPDLDRLDVKWAATVSGAVGALRDDAAAGRDAQVRKDAEAESRLAHATQLLEALGEDVAKYAERAVERDRSYLEGIARVQNEAGVLRADLDAFYKGQLSQRLDGLLTTAQEEIARRLQLDRRRDEWAATISSEVGAVREGADAARRDVSAFRSDFPGIVADVLGSRLDRIETAMKGDAGDSAGQLQRSLEAVAASTAGLERVSGDIGAARREFTGAGDLLKAMIEAAQSRQDALLEAGEAATPVADALRRLRDEILAAQEGLLAESHTALKDVIVEYMNSRAKSDRKQLDWTTTTGRMIGEMRQHEIATLVSKIEEFGHRLQADLRARAAYSVDRDVESFAWASATARAIDGLRSSLPPQPAAGDPSSPEAATALQPDGEPAGADSISRQGAGAADPQGQLHVTRRRNRRFALRGISVAPELQGLLALGEWVIDDPRTSVALAGITRPAVRALFPEDREQIRTIPLASGIDLDADMRDIFAATAALGWIQETDDFELFMSLVEPGARVVDVGANFGLYAIHAALYAGPDGRVFAFEPSPSAYALLASNAQRNGFAKSCLCFQAAVGAEPGKANFFLAADSAFSGLRDTGRSPIVGQMETEVMALDSHPKLRRIAGIDLMKIDVEGSEAGVLAGARKLIERSADILVMFEFSYKNLNDGGRDALMLELERFEAAGFGLQGRSRDGLEFTELRVADIESRTNENLFMSRPASPVRKRLHAMIDKAGRRVITPEQAAALALLKRQAGTHGPEMSGKPGYLDPGLRTI